MKTLSGPLTCPRYLHLAAGLAVNEFRSSRYSTLVANGKELGEVMLEEKGLKSEKYWMWLGIVATWIILLFYSIATTAVLAYVEHGSSYSSSAVETKPRKKRVGSPSLMAVSLKFTIPL